MPVTALTGTRFGATFRHTCDAGTARSREKAKSIREAAVTDAVPQYNCATTATNSRVFASVGPSAVLQM